MKSYYFLLLAVTLFSNCQSQSTENQETYPTETHKILASFYPELKQFYIENDFCTIDDDIAVGNRNLMLHLSEHQAFGSLKEIEIHDSTCQKMNETDIYNRLWDIQVAEATNLDNEKYVSITKFQKQDSDYYKWLNSNYSNFQPFLKNWYSSRLEIPSRASYHFFYREKSELDSINYADEVFTNAILIEFFIRYLDNVCPFETIKFEESQLSESHKIINSFKPELKQFYIKNDFCKAEDDISVGNKNFIAHISEHKFYQHLKPFTIQDSTCQKLKETDIYLKLWKVDTMEVFIGDLDGTVGKKDTIHKETYHIETDFYLWILENYKYLQPTLQSWLYSRLVEFKEIESRFFLIYSDYRLERIDYEDEMLTNTIIIEFLIRHLYLNCN